MKHWTPSGRAVALTTQFPFSSTDIFQKQAPPLEPCVVLVASSHASGAVNTNGLGLGNDAAFGAKECFRVRRWPASWRVRLHEFIIYSIFSGSPPVCSLRESNSQAQWGREPRGAPQGRWHVAKHQLNSRPADSDCRCQAVIATLACPPFCACLGVCVVSKSDNAAASA